MDSKLQPTQEDIKMLLASKFSVQVDLARKVIEHAIKIKEDENYLFGDADGVGDIEKAKMD
jgi:hypothetical protein